LAKRQGAWWHPAGGSAWQLGPAAGVLKLIGLKTILGQWVLPGQPVVCPWAACSVRAGACRWSSVRATIFGAVVSDRAAGCQPAGGLQRSRWCSPPASITQPSRCLQRPRWCLHLVLYRRLAASALVLAAGVTCGAVVPARAAGCQPPCCLQRPRWCSQQGVCQVSVTGAVVSARAAGCQPAGGLQRSRWCSPPACISNHPGACSVRAGARTWWSSGGLQRSRWCSPPGDVSKPPSACSARAGAGRRRLKNSIYMYSLTNTLYGKKKHAGLVFRSVQRARVAGRRCARWFHHRPHPGGVGPTLSPVGPPRRGPWAPELRTNKEKHYI